MADHLSIAEIVYEKKLAAYDRSTEEGTRINFGMLDYELFFVMDPFSNERIPAFPHIDRTAKLLYTILCSFVIKDIYFCYPKRETLAEILGISGSTLDTKINDLYDLDLIEVLKYGFQGAREKLVFIINRLNKKQIYEDICFYKRNQPANLKPAVIKPFIDYELIEYALNHNCKDTFHFISDKRNAPKKDRKRDVSGRFAYNPDGKNYHRDTDGENYHRPMVDISTARWSNLPCNNIDSNNIDLNESEAKIPKNQLTFEVVKEYINQSLARYKEDIKVWDVNFKDMTLEYEIASENNKLIKDIVDKIVIPDVFEATTLQLRAVIKK